MEGILAILLIFGGIPATIILIFIASRRHKERMEMISKGVNLSLFTEPPNPQTGSFTLLFGLFAVAIGLAFTISSILIMENFDRDMMTVAMVFLFGGGSLLLHWRITAKDRERARRLQEEHLARVREEYRSPMNKEAKTEGSVNVDSGEARS